MTERYLLWREALVNRDRGMYSLMILAVLFVVSYLVTYVPWIPERWGRYLRISYEIGGVILFVGMILVSAK